MATTIATGRSRTLKFDGDLSLPIHGKYAYITDPMCPSDYTADMTERGTGRIEIYGAWFVLLVRVGSTAPSPFLPICGPPYPGGTMKTRYEVRAMVTDPTHTIIYNDSGWVNGSYTTHTILGTFDVSGPGTFEATCPVVENGYFDLLDPSLTDSDGFPDYTLGAAQDGPLGQSAVFYETVETGGTFDATITVAGVTASASYSTTGNEFDFGAPYYGLTCYVRSEARSHTQVTEILPQFQDEDMGYAWSFTNASNVFDSTTGAKATCVGGTGVSDYTEGTAILFYPREVSIEAEVRAIGGSWPGTNLDVEWIYGRAYNSGTASWDEATRDFAISPSGSDSYTQQRWDITADCNGTGSSTSGDEWAPCRFYLTQASLTAEGEDSADWRLMARGKRWLAGVLEDDDPYTIEDGASASEWSAGAHSTVTATGGAIRIAASGGTGSATMTPALAIRPETHRYMRFRVRCNGQADVPLTVTLDNGTVQRVWSITTGADGTYVSQDIDLCRPKSGITVTNPDEKNSRYPLVSGEVDDSLTWGVSKIDTITIDGVPNGTNVELDYINIERTSSLKLSFLPAFEKWTSLVSGGAEGIPFVWGIGDGRVTDVYGQSRSGGVYSFPNIDAVMNGVATFTALTWTPEAVFPDSFHTNSLEGLFIEGNGVSYHASAFDYATEKAITLTNIYAQACWDQVEAYPLCGDVWGWNGGGFTGGMQVKTAKVLRGQAWGLVFNRLLPYASQTVEYQTSAGSSRGSDATDVEGIYATGTPWGYGSGNHKVVWGTKTSTNLANVNRWPRRVSWLGGLIQRICGYAIRRDLMNYRALASGGSVTVEKADNSLTAWSAVGSTVTGDECCLAVTPTAILLGVIDGTSFKVYKSTGGSWTLSITITATGTPSCPVAVVATDDCQFMYWLDSGTVKGTRLDGDGNALSSEFTATGIGTVDDGGLSGDSGPGSGNSRKIRLCAIESGVPIVYSSTDGEAFS